MFKPTHSLDKFKKREDVFELESQFILRLPLGAAQQLRRAVQSGAMNLKDRMSIELQPDMRNGTVRFDGMVFSAKLVDLPCIIETQKTLDRKTFYKTAYICQMVICKETFDQSSQDEDGTGRKRDKKKEDKKYLWNHGITPPLKNVRKRRFRKTARKKYIEQPDVEKEVKALFKLDNEAVKVRWEVVTEDSDKKESMPISTGETTNIITLSPKASKANLLDVAISDIFGEAVSSSEDEAEINVMDLHDEESSQGPIQTSDLLAHAMGDVGVEEDTHSETATGLEEEEDEDRAEEETEDWLAELSPPPQNDGESELQKRVDDVGHQLVGVKDRRRAQQLQIETIDNEALRQRLQQTLEQLTEEEKVKQDEYDQASEMLRNEEEESFLRGVS